MSPPQFLHLLVFATCPCIAVMCFQPPILLGGPCCAWGPKQGRREILSGPCCESLAGLANSASPGCNGINQTQLASLEILCTTTSFTSEVKPHGPPPPLLPTPQGTAEHRSIFHCTLSQESQTLPHLTAECYSCCYSRLLLASLPPHFSLSSFVLRTGQGPAAELVMSDKKIQYIGFV